jgi:DNA-binding PadR family transcriptional regulator
VKAAEKMKRKDNAETLRTPRSAERPKRIAGARRKLALTTPDLVLLSLLAERPMHGYQANLELERREIRDWAGISRPQVYYSLEKLSRAGMIRASESDEPAAGPERSTFETTAKGSAALANALSRGGAAGRPFLTGCAFWQARGQSKNRSTEEFFEAGTGTGRGNAQGVLEEVGHRYHEAVWMID